MPELVTDTYLTIESPSKGLFKDKGSKFIAFAFPVSTEQEIKDHLEKIKKEYFDARHHCFAYRLGADMKVFRAFDDGEPSSSAGKPILGQIVSSNLTNILIVVVRYFGGTLLGVGSLIQAYKNSSADAIANAQIIEKEVLDTIKLTFDYALQNNVNRVIKEFNIKIVKSEFDYNCKLELHCRKKLTEAFVQKIKELLHVEINLNEIY
jgi:uncharacterized YigZ family protein